jgi:hypothetical protein
MKIYILTRCYDNFADIWKCELAYYKDKDLAEYLALELDKKYGRANCVWFEVNEKSLIYGSFEDYQFYLSKLEEEYKTEL